MCPMSERRYPLPAGDDRFTYQLIAGVARVLAEHGYPAISADDEEDFLALQTALYAFLHRGPA